MGLEMVAALPIALELLLSGLLVNAIQMLLMLLVLPFSRNVYRRLNAALTGSYWSQMIWLVERWGRLKLTVFTDPETWAHMGKENALVICNHRSDVDWVVGWTLAQRTGCLGTTRALMKAVIKYLPVIGWSMWFSEYIFLSRDFSKDEKVIKAGYERFHDFPLPFWVALFVEGTRYTETKLKTAQEYAQSAGLPVPRNTLVPRTKGFVLSVECLRDFVPTIVDITVMVPDGVPSPTFTGFLKRQESQMHIHIRRVSMADLPADSEGIAKWCRDAFLIKDELLEEHKKTNSFDPKLLLPMEPSPWPIYCVVLWTAIVVLGLAWSLAHFSGAVTLSWGSLAVLLGLVAITAGILQVLIHFTKSEYSTPLKAVKPRPTAPSGARVEEGPLLQQTMASDAPGVVVPDSESNTQEAPKEQT